MLPMQLLRVKTRKGSILPQFCTSDDQLQLAEDIIKEFEESAARREKRKSLDERIAAIEARFADFKLVRGFSALLERRCQFSSSILIDTPADKSKYDGLERQGQTTETVADATTNKRPEGGSGNGPESGSFGAGTGSGDAGTGSGDASTDTADDNHDHTVVGQKLDVDVISDQAGNPEPAIMRRALFEESSKMGFALTEFERENIIASVASRLNLSAPYVKQAMWSDLEENAVLEQFDSIDKEQLTGWYNLSLMQTLIFNCTRLKFSVHSGPNWRQVLRKLNRLGLMYSLQESVDQAESEDKTHGKKGSNASEKNDINASNSAHEHELECIVDGPLSLFKLTDRYGTSIAKLLPSIVSTERWSLDASTIRKTMSGKKIYQFAMSSEQAPQLLWDPYHNGTRNKGETSSMNDALHSDSATFDSSVEAKFASRFEQSANGWKLVREPDPIIVSGGRAFIPDFVFEKYGRKVYLEIVGFWTEEYLKRKMQKIVDVVSKKKIDLFLAVSEKLACSKIGKFPSSPIQSFPKDRIIFYKNDSVPVRTIVDYLKGIDGEVIESSLRDPSIAIKFDGTKEVISMEEIASDRKLPLESAIRIASRDNKDDYLNAGPFFISVSKAKQLAELLKEAIKFSDACALLSKNAIPESCHAELVSKLGYNVVWQNMDASSAVIVKRK